MNDLVPEELNHGCQDYIFRLTENDYDPLWEEISRKDPNEIVKNALVKAIGSGGFAVKMIGADYWLDVRARCVTGPMDRRPPDKSLLLSLAYYVNGATPDVLSKIMVPEKVLPWGDLFFSGTHALKRAPILNRFSKAGQEFIKTAESLGAEIMSGGPGSFSFMIKLLPKIVVQVTLGEEDEEFPAQVSYAFDNSAAKHVRLGVLAYLVSVLNDQLVLSAAKSAAGTSV
jgi:hypothetical protein